LFFEPQLSGDGTVSCASCHDPAKGFSDGVPVAVGIKGRKGNRNTPTIYEVGQAPLLFWDGRVDNLTEQALHPIVNPKEMDASLDTVARRLNRDSAYRAEFRAVYGEAPSPLLIGKAIAAFEKALTLKASAWDRHMAGDKTAMTDQQKRGWQTFQRAQCIECHTPPAFTDNKFHNLGVGTGASQPDQGRMAATHKQADWGAFKTPTLRNVRQSGPWMHNGSFQSLEEVMTLYIQQGIENPHLDPFMKNVRLNWREALDVLAFLDALSSGDNLDTLRPQQARR
jgi:cytochrome c peroxidase